MIKTAGQLDEQSHERCLLIPRFKLVPASVWYSIGKRTVQSFEKEADPPGSLSIAERGGTSLAKARGRQFRPTDRVLEAPRWLCSTSALESASQHVFGTLKHWMGSTHFLTRRLGNVSTEMS